MAHAAMSSIHPAVRTLLEGPAIANYPLPPGETREQWRESAVAALDALEARGLLTLADRLGGLMATSLHQLATAPLGGKLELEPGRRRLLGELICNLAEPGRINQGHKGTCAVACIEVFLAIRQPAEYARLCVGLAVGEGRVPLPGAGVLQRDEERLHWHLKEARRSPVSRLLQVSLMERSDPEHDYRNVEDGHFDRETQRSVGTGVALRAFEALLGALTGEAWSSLSQAGDQTRRFLSALIGNGGEDELELDRDGMDVIAEVLRAHDACFVTLARPGQLAPATGVLQDLSQMAHKVRVIALEGEEVIYEDPADPEDPWMEGVPSRVIDREGRCAMGRRDFRVWMVELTFKKRFARMPKGGRLAP
jgi:hypothetical protein